MNKPNWDAVTDWRATLAVISQQAGSTREGARLQKKGRGVKPNDNWGKQVPKPETLELVAQIRAAIAAGEVKSTTPDVMCHFKLSRHRLEYLRRRYGLEVENVGHAQLGNYDSWNWDLPNVDLERIYGIQTTFKDSIFVGNTRWRLGKGLPKWKRPGGSIPKDPAYRVAYDAEVRKARRTQP